MLPLTEYRALESADRKYRNGDSISDDELALLVRHYKAASNAMSALSDQSYRLAKNDINRRWQELEGYQNSRRGRITL